VLDVGRFFFRRGLNCIWLIGIKLVSNDHKREPEETTTTRVIREDRRMRARTLSGACVEVEPLVLVKVMRRRFP